MTQIQLKQTCDVITFQTERYAQAREALFKDYYKKKKGFPDTIKNFDDAAFEMKSWAWSLYHQVERLMEENDRLRGIIKKTDGLSEFNKVCEKIRDAVNLLQECETIKKACEERADYTLEKFAIVK